MAEERFPLRREFISPTSSEIVILRSLPISFRPFQNASSTLTLVLCPATAIDRLIIMDCIVISFDKGMRLKLTIGSATAACASALRVGC